MTGYINAIQEAIYYLLAKGCKREELIICFSPLIDYYIVDEIYQNGFYFVYEGLNDLKNKTHFEGILLNKEWPYNEIVVYDKKQACINDYLIAKIKVIDDVLYLETLNPKSITKIIE